MTHLDPLPSDGHPTGEVARMGRVTDFMVRPVITWSVEQLALEMHLNLDYREVAFVVNIRRRFSDSKLFGLLVGALACLCGLNSTWGAENVLLTEVPDYSWYAGCFGTASGNLMGYWDRHGFPNFYTGPTAGGVAPLDSNGSNAGIRSMWASRAGFDGRAADQPGHIDDYWLYYDEAYSYESTAPDPYVTAGRTEHAPDCLGDFIGLSQNKWTNLNGECDGNIDAFSFVFWDAHGTRRVNYVPSQNGQPVPDIPSGLRAWTEYRKGEADVFSQLAEFNPNVPSGQGFTFEDLKAEIDAGYPVLAFLQGPKNLFRALPGMARANPEIHGILVFGYYLAESGNVYVRFKTSWGSSGDNTLALWGGQPWLKQLPELPVRGFIGFHPKPKITRLARAAGGLTLEWDGPSSVLSNVVSKTSTPLHQYVVEKATSADGTRFETVAGPTFDHTATVTPCCGSETAFFRVQLVAPTQRQESP